MTSSITSSSSSSSSSSSNSTASVVHDHDKKRPLTSNENAATAHSEASSSKRQKTETPSAAADPAIESILSEAVSIWSSENNALVAIAAQPLLKSPLTLKQQQLVKKLMKTTAAETDKKKDEAGDSIFHDDLYQRFVEGHLKAESQKSSLKFLATAIECRQVSLVKMLLKKVSLNEENEETYKCFLNAAKSTPEIASLLLEIRNPYFSNREKITELHYYFFKLAFLHQHATLYDSLKIRNASSTSRIDFTKITTPKDEPELVDLCINILQTDGPLKETILDFEPLCRQPTFLWHLIENRFDLDDGRQVNDEDVEKAFEDAILKGKIKLPLDEKGKASIQKVIDWSNSLDNEEDNFENLISSSTGESDQKEVIDSIYWLMDKGAKLTDSALESMEAPLRLAFLKMLPKTYPEAKKVFQHAFNIAEEEFMQVLEIANAYSDDLIDWQEALDYILKNDDISDNEKKFAFLKQRGAKIIFSKEPSILLFSRFKNIKYFRQESNYCNLLYITDPYGFGVLTHLIIFAGQNHENVNKCLTPLDEVSNDILKDRLNESRINRKDLFSAYLLLSSYKLHPPKNFTILLSHFLKGVKFSILDSFRSQLVHWFELTKLPIDRGPMINHAFEEFITNNEFQLFACGHLKSTLAYLTQDQKKQIASVDYRGFIENLLKLSSNQNVELPVRDFLARIKERSTPSSDHHIHLTAPDKLVKSASFEPVLKPFEKDCRALIPEGSYIKFVGSFEAYMRLNVIADPSMEPILKSLKVALEKLLASKNELRTSVKNDLLNFAAWQIRKELFYLDIEDKLRLLAYPYTNFKIPDKGGQILDMIVRIVSLSSERWAEEFQPWETDAVFLMTKQIDPTSAVECEWHSVLAAKCIWFVLNWALRWNNLKIKELESRNASAEQIKAAQGFKIHYALAALKRLPYFADMIGEPLVQWTSEMNDDLSLYFRAYFSPSRLMKAMPNSERFKSSILKFLTEKTMGNWNVRAYQAIEKELLSVIYSTLGYTAISNKYEEIMKKSFEKAEQREKEIEKAVFMPVWERLSKEQKVSFDYDSVRKAIVSGKSYAHIKSALAKVINESVSRGRQLDFGKTLCDENQQITSYNLRCFLKLCNDIVELENPTGDVRL